MRTLTILFVLVISASVLALVMPDGQKEDKKVESSPVPTVLGKPAKPKNSLDISDANVISRIAWFEIADINSLALHPNFDEKLSVREFNDQDKCRFLINSGFYTEDNTPTGLFISDSIRLKGWQENALFNGVLSINAMGTPRITRTQPADPLKIAVQTGPVLIENNQVQSLTIRNDRQARRMVAAVTGDNVLYFLTLFNPDSVYLGPQLGDLPKLLGEFEEETNIDFADAINLDGGSASTFITDDLSLTEYSPVGSFFCVE